MSINEYMENGYSIQDLLNQIGKLEKENTELKKELKKYKNIWTNEGEL